MSGALDGISIRLVLVRAPRGLWTTGAVRVIRRVMVDSYVERALVAMKREPSRRWTVGALARVAGLSRAPFARRFERATGKPPLRYLTELRLRLAAARLVASDALLAEIAIDAGYATEFSFAKAFKRAYGVAPGLFRKRAWSLATAVRAVCMLRAA
jgi:AraC-like DNA-binding protein